MSRIVFFTCPIASPTSAALNLAGALRERGHEVVFAGMVDGRSKIERCGFSFVPLFEDWLPEGTMSSWLGGPTNRTWRDRISFYLDERRKMIEHERYVDYLIAGGHREFGLAMADLAPDLLLVDMDLHAYWAVMAVQTRITTAYLSTLLPVTEDPVVPPFNSLLTPARDWRSRLSVWWAWNRHFAGRWLRRRAMWLVGIADSSARIERLARSCGVSPDRLNQRTISLPVLDLPTVIVCPAEFDFPEARERPHRHYAGPAVDLDRKEPDFPWDELDPSKRLIFCSLGSVAFNRQFFQHVIDAVAREPDWQLVVNVGPTLKRTDFARVPATTITVNGAPQLGLLERADAMINHGGAGSVRECIYFGVPQVVFPIGFDQPGAAARVRYHGLGLAGSFRDAHAEMIHTLVSRVLDEPRFKARSAAMSEVFRVHEHEQAGAAIIERLFDSLA